MNTYELMNEVLGYKQVRLSSCYIVIDRVLLRIADHQANNINFECFNDVEEYDAILNVIISDGYVDQKKFEDYLDEKNMNGEIVVLSPSDDIKDCAEYVLSQLKRVI